MDPLMESIRQHMGLEEEDTSRDHEILMMSHHERMDKFLTWNGIIGFTRSIFKAYGESEFMASQGEFPTAWAQATKNKERPE